MDTAAEPEEIDADEDQHTSEDFLKSTAVNSGYCLHAEKGNDEERYEDDRHFLPLDVLPKSGGIGKDAYESKGSGKGCRLPV